MTQTAGEKAFGIHTDTDGINYPMNLKGTAYGELLELCAKLYRHESSARDWGASGKTPDAIVEREFISARLEELIGAFEYRFPNSLQSKGTTIASRNERIEELAKKGKFD